jgi:hypothetical protein
MYRPPLTAYTWPVMYVDSGSARTRRPGHGCRGFTANFAGIGSVAVEFS